MSEIVICVKIQIRLIFNRAKFYHNLRKFQRELI